MTDEKPDLRSRSRFCKRAAAIWSRKGCKVVSWAEKGRHETPSGKVSAGHNGEAKRDQRLTEVAVATTSVAEYRTALRCLRRTSSPSLSSSASAWEAPSGVETRVERGPGDDVAAQGSSPPPQAEARACRSMRASCIFCASVRRLGELVRRETATASVALSHVPKHHGQRAEIRLGKSHLGQTYSGRFSGAIWRHGSESHLFG